MARVTFVLDNDLHEKLKAYASLQHENISEVLRRAAIEYVHSFENPPAEYTTPVNPGLKQRRVKHR